MIIDLKGALSQLGHRRSLNHTLSLSLLYTRLSAFPHPSEDGAPFCLEGEHQVVEAELAVGVVAQEPLTRHLHPTINPHPKKGGFVSGREAFHMGDEAT